MKAQLYMWRCKLNNTISIYRLILITYARLLIFPLLYKYQQMNLFKLHCKCQHFLCTL